MMLAPTIKELLQRGADRLGIDPAFIFAYTIDPEVRANDVDDLVVVITEIDDTPSNYGSNHSINREANVQTQIFFPRTYTDDTSKLRDQIKDLLEDRQWSCTYDTGIERDPSVDMLANTARWRKIYKE